MGVPTLHTSGARTSWTAPQLTSVLKELGPAAAPRTEHCALAIFIGGAGDKQPYYLTGPYRNITYAQAPFERRIAQAGLAGVCRSLYLGYHEVHSASAIERLILPVIPDKATPIYIVGHSIGAWNGAHLSHRLSEWGYRVEMLVTLDPVGSGLLVRLGSRIHYRQPVPRSGFWINVRAEPGQANASDRVAQLGRKWHVAGQPDIDEALDINHANAWALFCKRLHDGRSAADRMFESIVGHLKG